MKFQNDYQGQMHSICIIECTSNINPKYQKSHKQIFFIIWFLLKTKDNQYLLKKMKGSYRFWKMIIDYGFGAKNKEILKNKIKICLTVFLSMLWL